MGNTQLIATLYPSVQKFIAFAATVERARPVWKRVKGYSIKKTPLEALKVSKTLDGAFAPLGDIVRAVLTARIKDKPEALARACGKFRKILAIGNFLAPAYPELSQDIRQLYAESAFGHKSEQWILERATCVRKEVAKLSNGILSAVSKVAGIATKQASAGFSSTEEIKAVEAVAAVGEAIKEEIAKAA